LKKSSEFSARFRNWKRQRKFSELPFCRKHPRAFYAFAARAAMMNLALISAAGAYIDGTEPFPSWIQSTATSVFARSDPGRSRRSAFTRRKAMTDGR
jgi:hypothetical protein